MWSVSCIYVHFWECIYVCYTWFEDSPTEEAEGRTRGLPTSWHLCETITISKFKSPIKNSISGKHGTDFCGLNINEKYHSV